VVVHRVHRDEGAGDLGMSFPAQSNWCEMSASVAAWFEAKYGIFTVWTYGLDVIFQFLL
jgi:hypothetical protein